MSTLSDSCEQATTAGETFVKQIDEILSSLEGLAVTPSKDAVFDGNSLDQGGKPFGRLREAREKGHEALEMFAKGVDVLRESDSFRDCFCKPENE